MVIQSTCRPGSSGTAGAFNPSRGRWMFEFKASLVYKGSSRTSRATEKPFLCIKRAINHHSYSSKISHGHWNSITFVSSNKQAKSSFSRLKLRFRGAVMASPSSTAGGRTKGSQSEAGSGAGRSPWSSATLIQLLSPLNCLRFRLSPNFEIENSQVKQAIQNKTKTKKNKVGCGAAGQ